MARAQAAEPQGGSAVRAGRPLARRRGASLPGTGRGAEPPGGRGGAAGGRPQAGTGEGAGPAAGAVVAGRGRGGSKREREAT